jgi:hypothetical protein
MKTAPPDKWKWFGVAGHFTCGKWCRFHLTTKVGKFLISTVGEYVHPRNSGASERVEMAWLEANWPGEDIGYKRKYETCVFVAGPPCNSKVCHCGQPKIVSAEIDSLPYNDRAAATVGHMKLCRKWANRQDWREKK